MREKIVYDIKTGEFICQNVLTKKNSENEKVEVVPSFDDHYYELFKKTDSVNIHLVIRYTHEEFEDVLRHNFKQSEAALLNNFDLSEAYLKYMYVPQVTYEDLCIVTTMKEGQND